MFLNDLVQFLEQFWKKGGKFKCAENTATWKCDEGKNHEWWWLLSKSDPTRDLAIIFMRPDHPWIGCKIEKKIQPPRAPTEKFFLFEVILLLQTILDSLFESETQINPHHHQLCRKLSQKNQLSSWLTSDGVLGFNCQGWSAYLINRPSTPQIQSHFMTDKNTVVKFSKLI